MTEKQFEEIREDFRYFNETFANVKRTKHQPPVYLYTEDYRFIGIFPTTGACADFLEKDNDYICNAICKGHRIKREGVWFRVSRKPFGERK